MMWSSLHTTDHSYCTGKYEMYGCRLPETVGFNSSWWSFSNYLSCAFVLNTLWSIISAFFTVEKHMAILMNRTYCWRYYLSFWLAHGDGCARECGCDLWRPRYYMVVWVSMCEKAKSLLRWPWKELPGLLVHKLAMKTEGDKPTECLRVYLRFV